MKTSWHYWTFPKGPRSMLVHYVPVRFMLPRVLLLRRAGILNDQATLVYVIDDDAVIDARTRIGRFPLTLVKNNFVEPHSHFDQYGALCFNSMTTLENAPDALWGTNTSRIPPDAAIAIEQQADEKQPIVLGPCPLDDHWPLPPLGDILRRMSLNREGYDLRRFESPR